MFNISIADTVIEIDNRYSFVEKYCKDYICDAIKEPDFRIGITDKEICDYVSRAEYEIDKAHTECLLVCRAISSKLPRYGCFLFHSAVISCPECTIAFSAPRGTGKTTHAMLWRDVMGEKADIISGDKPFIRKVGDDWIACSTPWNGKERIGRKSQARLDAVVFLEQASENSAVRIDQTEFARRLAEQVIYPSDSCLQEKFADIAADMIKCVPAYVLRCNISRDAVYTVYRAVTGKDYKN